MIDSTFITETLQKLVQINSVNPQLEAGGAGEQDIGRYIYKLLDGMGIEAVIDEIVPGRVNVTGMIRGEGGGKSLMLNAHMDTVGVIGMADPFSGKISDGKLYGRGSYDMKGSIASILATAKSIKDKEVSLKGDLVLSFVADEEYESIGAQALMKQLKTDAAIVTEPTGMDICLAHRGFGIHKITITGKTAHGGNHKLGIDANLKVGLLLAELEEFSKTLSGEKKHPLCGEASMHVPLISGGRSLFIYSNECTIHVERRTLPGETVEEVESGLEYFIDKLQKQDPEFNAKLERVIWRSPYEIMKTAPIVRVIQKALLSFPGHKPSFIGHTWWEDSAIFGEAGIETVILGPKGGGIHEDIEWVEVDSVIDLARILYHSATSYCN